MDNLFYQFFRVRLRVEDTFSSWLHILPFWHAKGGCINLFWVFERESERTVVVYSSKARNSVSCNNTNWQRDTPTDFLLLIRITYAICTHSTIFFLCFSTRCIRVNPTFHVQDGFEMRSCQSRQHHSQREKDRPQMEGQSMQLASAWTSLIDELLGISWSRVTLLMSSQVRPQKKIQESSSKSLKSHN